MSKGQDFQAVNALYDSAHRCVAKPGDTCEGVPDVSLGWLEEQGHIRRIEKKGIGRFFGGAPKPAPPPSAVLDEDFEIKE